MSTPKNRRNFLKNSSLAALGIGLAPAIARTSPDKKSHAEDDFIGCFPTTLDLYGEGPFYTENAPFIENGELSSETEDGIKLTISGRVMNQECTEYLANTVIDVWHANDAGEYDNEGYTLRGRTVTNAEGFYLFETIKPGKYLNGGQFRPSHIHFKITPEGGETLTTQLYFFGDEDIPADAAASVTSGVYNASGRIINLFENENGDLEGIWDIVVNAGDTNGLNDLHLDKGVIYKTHPNPFTDELTISYGVFKPSRASIVVFDMAGREVATLEEKMLKPEKYEATWKPKPGLPDGHYFISLKINDLQVNYMKVMKQSGYGY
ncbi:MAG: T9SS type A sorting domain-containing protein [Flavobacteriales bacterium]